MGECNRSGNPAGGQYDVVPLETAEDLSRYKALAFVGWNDMNDAQYAKLLEYVRNGGHLLIWPAHCNVSGKRTELRLYRDGDLSELCGLRIKGWKTTDVRGFKFVSADSLLGDAIPYWGSRHDPWWMGKITPAEIEITEKNARILAGFSYHIREYDSDLLAEPALIEHRVGKGMVWTVAVREYPGDGGAFPFAEALLTVPFQKGKVVLYSNKTAEPYGENIAELLSAQICNPVRWEESIRHMMASGIDTFIEVGPGKTLVNMMKKIDAQAKVYSVSELSVLLSEVAKC